MQDERNKDNQHNQEEDLEELVERYAQADIQVPVYTEELSHTSERNKIISLQGHEY